MSATPDTKKIYIVISQTGTILSRILKALTKNPYNHSSVALREDLHVLWSFGRRHPYNPFWGGFVKESPFFGTFKRFKKTTCMVLETEITAEAYADLEALFEDMLAHRNRYHYNTLGVALVPTGIYWKRKNRFYCSEFVRMALVRARVPGFENLPEIVQPIDFLKLPHRVVYVGSLREYADAHPKKE